MSPATVRRIGFALVGIALLVAASGFLWGWLRTGDAPRAQPAAGTAETAAGPSRDSSLALRTLDARGHWGRYTPPAGGVVEQARAPRTVAADAIAQAYRLVGIEHREGEPMALLLPAGAAEDSSQLIRLRRGEALADGISVSAIETDSVRFTTASGSSTLHLYGSTP